MTLPSGASLDAARQVDDLLQQLTVPTRLGEKPGLERIRQLLKRLGNPQEGLTILHIGGTSGKGSTATIAAAIFQEAGYRVGLHVKPHLESVNERFVVAGVEIGSERLLQLVQAAAPAAEDIRPSWYELTVALAIQYFHQEAVQLAVIEVGLGGTYDATNVVQPGVTVLTNVGLDHTEVLGDTVELIAADKTGIFKPGVVAISGATQDSVKAIVRDRSAAVGAPLLQLGRDFDFRVRDVGLTGSHFDLSLGEKNYPDCEIGLLGAHQVGNAALAAVAAETFARQGFPLADTELRRGLARVRVPGRLELAHQDPLVVLDGAHNPAKMAALAEALRVLFPGRRVVGLLAAKRGHDVAATLQEIAPRLDEAILTRFDGYTDFGPGQSIEPSCLTEMLDAMNARLRRRVEEDPEVALAAALDAAGRDGLVCVTGSLYLVGAVRGILRTLS